MKRIIYLMVFFLWLLVLSLQGQTVQKYAGTPHYDSIPTDALSSEAFGPEVIYSIADQALVFWDRAGSIWSVLKTVVSRGDLVIQDLSIVDPLNGDTILLKRGNVWHKAVVDSLLAGGATGDADADPTNEYNTSVNLNGTTLEITDPGGTLSQDLSSLSGNTNLSTNYNSNSVGINSDTGSDAVILAATATSAGVMDVPLWVKLNNIETGATQDQTGAEIVSAIDTELGNQDWQSGGGGGSGDLSAPSDLTINRVPYASAVKELSDSPIEVDAANGRVAINDNIAGSNSLTIGGRMRINDGLIEVHQQQNNAIDLFQGYNNSGTLVLNFITASNQGVIRALANGTTRIELNPLTGMLFSDGSNSIAKIGVNQYQTSFYGTRHIAFNQGVGAEGSSLHSTSPSRFVEFNNNKGLLLPRGTTAERPPGEAAFVRYNTTTGLIEFYDGTDWQSLAKSESIPAEAYGEAFTSGGFVTYDLSSTQVVTGLSAGNLENFTHSAGVLTYTGSSSGQFAVHYSLSMSDTDVNTDEIIVRLRVNNSVIINAGGECRTVVETSGGTSFTANCSGMAILDLDSGNDVSIELSSAGAPTIEVKSGSFLIKRIH